MRAKNIVLIGFMGSGKSSVGHKLASLLGWRFVDTDTLIGKAAGKKINKIFKESGEAHFRSLESQVVKEVASSENQVIACGGGVVLRSENIENLKKNGLIVYLKTSPSKIYDRIKHSKKRPLLDVSDIEGRIKTLLSERENIYESVADVVIDTSDLTIDDVVEKIKLSLS